MRRVAAMVRQARRITFVTGAGMSTACGIRDYRSGADTCLPTGQVRHSNAVEAGAQSLPADARTR